MPMPILSDEFLRLAQRVLLSAWPTYGWIEVVMGVRINGTLMAAVATNTWRGFTAQAG